MDSITQFALGGAVGVAVAGKAKTKYFLAGGLIATLPDLDIVLQYDNAIEKATSHRGFSHSLLFLTFVSPFLALVIGRFFNEFNRLKLLRFVWWVLITHPLLDSLTTYGTQLLWPIEFVGSVVSIGSIFIIDPIYSVWLIVIGVLVFRGRIGQTKLIKWNYFALGISSLYLFIGVLTHQIISNKVEDIYPKHDIKVMSGPFNGLSWRVLGKNKQEFFDGCINFTLDDVKINHAGNLNHQLISSDNVSRYGWFSNGWYQLERVGNDIVLNDLRMGISGKSVFRFKVGEIKNGSIIEVLPSRMPRAEIDFSKLSFVCKN